MSLMKAFCHFCSLNGLPLPMPAGTVSNSMKSITRFARLFPAALRVTCLLDQLAELCFLPDGVRPDAGSSGRGKSEFDGMPQHLARCFAFLHEQRMREQPRPAAVSLLFLNNQIPIVNGLPQRRNQLPPHFNRMAIPRQRLEISPA